MVKIDRGFVLKTFLDRIVEAKRLNMSDIRMSVKELDDVAYVIYCMMSEQMSKIMDYVDVTNDTVDTKQTKKQSKPKVILENIKINKVVRDDEKPVEKIENSDIIEETNESEDDSGIYMFGGTF